MQRPRADSAIPGAANHSSVRSSLVHDHPARVPDNGLMTADAGPEPVTTGSRRLVPGEAEAGGYRPLVAADGERHRVRDDLAGMSLPAGWRRSARPLLGLRHPSDTHA